jgi:hypothetical protein
LKTIRNILLLLILTTKYSQAQGSDTLKSAKFKLPQAYSYDSNISASYISYKNWKYNGYNNFSFILRENLNYDSIAQKTETHLRINAELGFMKFSDSIWYKNSDLLDLSLEISRNSEKRIRNVFSLSLNTQLLSSYEIRIDSNGEEFNAWSSGFCNPLSLDLSYGSSVRFWKSSRININYVNLRTTVQPLPDPSSLDSGSEIIYKKSLIRSEYGFTIQTFIRHNLSERLRWESHSKIFANAINRERIELDLRSKFSLRLLKYFNLILDSRLKYTPSYPSKLQFRNELMLAFTFGNLN